MLARAATILNVDDNDQNRSLFSLFLREEGFQVIEAATGIEALRCLSDHPDLVLLDVRLPDISGYDVCRQIKANPETADIPVLHISAYLIAAGDKARGLEGGADAYLVKPVEPTELVATVRALLRHHEIEEASRTAARQWQTTFDAIQDGVALLDPVGRIERCNRALAAMIGQDPDALAGRLFAEAWPGSALPNFRRMCERCRQRRSHESDEFQDSDHYYCINLDSVLDDDGNVTGIVCVLEDLTERNHLEAQLRQAQKMEAIGRLAGGIAHDFNNLLTGILGYSDLVLASLPPADSLVPLVHEIEKASQRAAALTDQLLAFSRMQVVQPRILDLNAVVGETVQMLRRLIGEDVELLTQLAPDLGPVKADAGQLQQVVMNLAVNARDAMPHGGRLWIETRNAALEDAYSRLGLRPGPYVLLSVRDSGCGIPPEVRPRIFEPFFTTKEPGKGTGLGLFTVYGIVKQCGGHIDVFSEPEQGTTFRIYLPRTGSRVPREVRPELKHRRPRGSETVLLVEDEAQVRAVVRTVLEQHGYRVLVAGDGVEACRLCTEYAGPIHLLVTDVVMPQMNGTDLARQLLAGHPHMRVLYVSGYTGGAVLPQDELEKNSAFLKKPFTAEALLCRVREVLDRR